jgi:hypothetical protein
MLSDVDTTYIFIEICQQKSSYCYSEIYTIDMIEINKLKKILEPIHYTEYFILISLKPIIVYPVQATISIFRQNYDKFDESFFIRTRC